MKGKKMARNEGLFETKMRRVRFWLDLLRDASYQPSSERLELAIYQLIYSMFLYNVTPLMLGMTKRELKAEMNGWWKRCEELRKEEGTRHYKEEHENRNDQLIRFKVHRCPKKFEYKNECHHYHVIVGLGYWQVSFPFFEAESGKRALQRSLEDWEHAPPHISCLGPYAERPSYELGALPPLFRESETQRIELELEEIFRDPASGLADGKRSPRWVSYGTPWIEQMWTSVRDGGFRPMIPFYPRDINCDFVPWKTFKYPYDADVKLVKIPLDHMK